MEHLRAARTLRRPPEPEPSSSADVAVSRSLHDYKSDASAVHLRSPTELAVPSGLRAGGRGGAGLGGGSTQSHDTPQHTPPTPDTASPDCEKNLRPNAARDCRCVGGHVRIPDIAMSPTCRQDVPQSTQHASMASCRSGTCRGSLGGCCIHPSPGSSQYVIAAGNTVSRLPPSNMVCRPWAIVKETQAR